ncbi:MAG: MFS transporter [Chloroflexota bacterium]|nr:MFS transporter [Chloroflexota bacterium]
MAISLAVPAHRRPLYTLYTANAISLAGNNLSTIAIPWFVLATTGSAAKTGLSGAFAILPVVIASVLGGAVVDRLGYRRSSIISDIASGISVGSIAVLHMADLLSYPLLLALIFLGAFLDTPGGTARAALLPDLAREARISIEAVSATTQIVERGSRLVSAPLAGVLIAAFGPVTALWVNMASFAISSALVAVGIPAVATHEEERPDEGYFASLRAGFAFVRNDALIKAVLATVAITNGLDMARSMVGLPYLAKEVYDSSIALGLMFAASGGGSVLGALLYARYGVRYRKRPVFIWSFVMVGVPTLVYALLPPLWMVVAGQFLMGFAAGPLNPILMTVEFARIPPAMRARVFGAITAGAFLAMPVGVLLGGVLIEGIGLRWSFLLIGLVYVVTTLTLAINPAIHEMDEVRRET